MQNLLLILCFFCTFKCGQLFGQTNNCNDNAGGQILPSTTCTFETWDVISNSEWWDGTNAGCGESQEDDEWGWFDLPANATSVTVTFTPDASNRDPVITIFSGACDASGTPVTCVDDGGDGVSESVTFTPIASTRYRVRLQEYSSGDNMNGDICVEYTASATPGDTPCTAINLITENTCINTLGSNVGTTDSGIGSPGCASYSTSDVWYTTTVPSSGNLSITTSENGGFTDGGLAAYSGTDCSSLSLIECNDDGNGIFSQINLTGRTAGEIIYIRVWDYDDGTGTFDICLESPAATTQDCNGGTTVCSDAAFSGNSDGSGSNSDLTTTNSGCLGSEHESSWYYFQAQTAGNLELTISTTVDYDFAVWGPYTSATLACPPNTAPLRCSFAAGNGDTGLRIGSGDTSEGSSGDDFVDEIVASAGDSYILLIDNFDTDGTGFTFNWTLSGGASLDCSPLPIIFGDFNITPLKTGNLLNWNTYSEINNSYFKIQKLEQDGYFYTIGSIQGQNNSSETIPYTYLDNRIEQKVNTYRIVQVDFDGEENIFSPKSVDNSVTSSKMIARHNIMGQEVSESYIGIVIITYEDGKVIKQFQTNQ